MERAGRNIAGQPDQLAPMSLGQFVRKLFEQGSMPIGREWGNKFAPRLIDHFQHRKASRGTQRRIVAV